MLTSQLSLTLLHCNDKVSQLFKNNIMYSTGDCICFLHCLHFSLQTKMMEDLCVNTIPDKNAMLLVEIEVFRHRYCPRAILVHLE